MIKTVEDLIAELQSLGNQHQKKEVVIMTAGIEEEYFHTIGDIDVRDGKVIIDAS